MNSNSLNIGDLTNSNGINVFSQLTGNQSAGGGASNQNVTPTFNQPNYKGGSGKVNLFDAMDSIEGVSALDPVRPSTKLVFDSASQMNRESYRGY